MSSSRDISHRYEDPLDVVWTSLACQLKMKIVRNSDAYASWDGRGTLTIAPPRDLDADDCLAQMVLHEVCHALVAGAAAQCEPDWGLADGDLVSEHATNRLQAALAGRFGLRRMLATTTNFREFYDALPEDPLTGDGPDAVLAREADERARCGPWAGRLREALRSTHALAKAVHPSAPDASLWSRFEPLHPSGLPRTHGREGEPRRSCGQCAWFVRDARGDGSAGKCRQARYAFVESAPYVAYDEPACLLWELPLSDEDCGSCGACCREGFDRVEVPDDDPVCVLHPEMVTREGDVRVIPRPGGRCLALVGSGVPKADAHDASHREAEGPFRCRIYRERPGPCAQFEVAGDACLEGRRRVGLSR